MATEVQVDNSHLPPVQEVCRDFAVLEDGALAYYLQEQEIEQHFTCNAQKSQLAQKDLQVARRLQDLEAEVAKIHVSRSQRQRAGRDSPRPWAPQEEMGQRVAGRRRRKEEEAHQEIVRRLQDLEKERSRQPQRGVRESRRQPLGRRAEEGEIQSREQLRQDEALARKLQEEERSHLRAWRNQERRGHNRAAQVAQDEEIAHYIQDQELKTHERKPSQGACRLSQPRWGSCSGSSQESPGSESRSSRATTGVGPMERPEGPTPVGGRQPLCRNIAEELDPTFRAERAARPAVEAFPISPEGNVFGYRDTTAAPPFVPPTKRQPEKVGYQKPRDKREGCKQQ